MQSFDDSEGDFADDTPKKRKTTKKEAATPAEASKAEIAKIEAELTKILKDEANDSMTYAGTMLLLCGEACSGRRYLCCSWCTRVRAEAKETVHRSAMVWG